MSKKNLIFSILLLIWFISACYLSVSPVKTGVEVDDDQDDLNITILSTPKSSGYAVKERWNDTTVGSVTCVAVSANGKYMAVATEDNLAGGETLFFYNTSNHDGRPMWSYLAPTNWTSLAISDDGSYIVAGTQVHHVAVLLNSSLPDPGEEKKEIWMVTLNDDVNSVDISADGKLIVVGGDNPGPSSGMVCLYNNSYSSSKSDEYLWICSPDDHVVSVAISADGNYVVAGTDYTAGPPSPQVMLFDTTKYALPGKVPIWDDYTGYNISSVAISAKGEYVVAGTVNQSAKPEVFVFSNAASGALELGDDRGDIQNIISVAISADGEYIATGGSANSGSGGYITLYNRSGYTHEPMWEYKSNDGVTSVDITADGKYIVAGTNYTKSTGDINENTIFLFNKSDDGEKHPEWYFNTSYDVNSVSISSWGNYIGAGGDSSSGEAFLFYHARPIPRIISGNGGGDDDDDDEEAAIPFGNHYLLFAAIAVASLVIITKRKAVFSKK